MYTDSDGVGLRRNNPESEDGDDMLCTHRLCNLISSIPSLDISRPRAPEALDAVERPAWPSCATCRLVLWMSLCHTFPYVQIKGQ